MYNSLKYLLNISYTLKPYVSKSASGVINFADPINGLCYAESKIVLVKNTLGKEVVSNTQLYIDGLTSIKDADHIVFEGADHDIAAIGTFYDKGVPSLKVVYL